MIEPKLESVMEPATEEGCRDGGPLLITAATEREIAQLVRETGGVPVVGNEPRPVWECEFAGHRLVLAITGIGKVNAASAATLVLERFAPRLLDERLHQAAGPALARRCRRQDGTEEMDFGRYANLRKGVKS